MDIAPADDAKAAATRTDAAAVACSLEPQATAALGTIAGPARGLLPERLRRELWLKADAELAQVTEAEFGEALEAIGGKHNFGLEPARKASPRDREEFWRALHVGDLALARGCALGRDAAWERFMARFRGPLTQAAVALTRSTSLGEELAGAMYAALFGVADRGDARRSPLERYSGRGSLMGWLRAMMAQQHVNHHRRTHRETELEGTEPAAPETAAPEPEVLTRLKDAMPKALASLSAEERFLLVSYFLDGHTLMEMGRVIGVHEATVSRKLKRVTGRVRKEMLRALVTGGLNRRAAEEALGADPRDVDVNLRKLLQTPQDKTYLNTEGRR